jgi:hypothetical protein
MGSCHQVVVEGDGGDHGVVGALAESISAHQHIRRGADCQVKKDPVCGIPGLRQPAEDGRIDGDRLCEGENLRQQQAHLPLA